MKIILLQEFSRFNTLSSINITRVINFKIYDAAEWRSTVVRHYQHLL